MMEQEQPLLPNLGPIAKVGPRIRSNKRKASDEQIVEAYRETGSLRQTAFRFGMCPQSVHERLVKLGENQHTNLFTEEDRADLIKFYEVYADLGELDVLAERMGRTKHFIARQARKLGLTKPGREKPYLAGATRLMMTEWHRNNPHPRGMLGKKHSDETRELFRNRIVSAETRNKLSDAMVLRNKNMSLEDHIALYEKRKLTWKAGWREIGGKRAFYRSRWEANYARYLEWLRSLGEIAKWEHEPKVFWFLKIKRGTRSYLPDFRVTENNGSIAYHEVKGWMDPKSKTKIKRMAQYYPEEKLIVIGAKGYRSLEKMVGRMIPGWEFSVR